MKIVPLLLACTVALQLFQPCGRLERMGARNDTIGQGEVCAHACCLLKGQDAADQPASNEESPLHSDHQKDCSPFCTCTCCGTSVMLPFLEVISIQQRPLLPSTVLIVLEQLHLQEYIPLIWQPPQLV